MIFVNRIGLPHFLFYSPTRMDFSGPPDLSTPEGQEGQPAALPPETAQGKAYSGNSARRLPIACF
jgi:hypothetical protein